MRHLPTPIYSGVFRKPGEVETPNVFIYYKKGLLSIDLLISWPAARLLPDSDRLLIPTAPVVRVRDLA